MLYSMYRGLQNYCELLFTHTTTHTDTLIKSGVGLIFQLQIFTFFLHLFNKFGIMIKRGEWSTTSPLLGVFFSLIANFKFACLTYTRLPAQCYM